MRTIGWAVPGAAVAVVLVALGIRRRLLVATVSGRSMEPALRSGDRLLVRRTPRARRGQIVVVRARVPLLDGPPPEAATAVEVEPSAAELESYAKHGLLLIKRVAAVGGDPVPREACPALRDVPEDVVPRGALVVVGDNRPLSWDSREFGYVRPGDCVGVAIRRMRL
ncbi:S26 family signal peptidase [Actinomadura decatromicini]|uniref:signal peptidase I n=1 Tax=Actinomadura decatromicini TaxID=2604572 RepID=A0A5D3FBN9_9ACTN|nr:S26 family signal peptidase [Actinomadura decatromicini]TYK45358.1 S26 family signal peptidase [Actinomadura decatromicini]